MRKIIISALFALFIAGCAATPKNYERAKKACENHGGLIAVSSWFNETTATCNNGVKVSWED